MYFRILSKFLFEIRFIHLLLLMGFGAVIAYDSPVFDHRIVDTDALHIPKQELETIVEMLNAVACNFPKSSLIDEDLREKALALALNLDPLNVSSRNAHHELLAGRTPPETSLFKSSVSEISERLWVEAEKMAGKNGQPESRLLSGYLAELSLVLHPEPPMDRVKQYARQIDWEPRLWNRFLKLQPEKNPSGLKLKTLFEMAQKPVKEPSPKRVAVQAEMPPEKPIRPHRPIVPAKVSAEPVSEVKLNKLEMPFVAQIQGMVQTLTLGGVASLEIKDTKVGDGDLLEGVEVEKTSRQNQMRLIPNPDGNLAKGLDIAEQLVKRTHPEWPDQMVAEFGFASEFPPQIPRRMARVDASLVASLLLVGAFEGREPVPGVAVVGSISDLSDTPQSIFSPGESLPDVLDQARAIKAEFILLPEAIYQDLVKGAIKTRALEHLFDPELIGYSDWNELKNLAFGEGSEARVIASGEFKKIQAVQSQMSLVALSKNAKVRERLEKIVADYPNHLSARVMLAFGAAPDDPEAIKNAAILGVDKAIESFVYPIARAISDDSVADLEFTEILASLDQADKALGLLQVEIHPPVRNYLFQAKEFLNETRTLVAGGKDSPSAKQRLGVVAKAFSELQLERVALGIEKISVEDYDLRGPGG